MTDFIEEMQSRGLLAQVIYEDEFREHLKAGPRTAYIGFDPTADSLHVGHLMQIMTLARWQRCGHRAIALMGGGTALVGDPTGKTDMRKMLTAEDIQANIAAFKTQMSGLLDLTDPERGLLVNNADWLLELTYLPFLREIGRHFSVNRMLTAECFKSRLEKGLSFLEFNYMVLQSYDFLHLFQEQDCTVQLGGDDQWSNILGGVDLVRRKQEGAKAFCLTTPLLTTSEGKKMGKTEGGAVWLDPEKTSPYEFFQYWRNVTDDMVEPCLRYFTFLPMDEVTELGAAAGAAINESKVRLAHELTTLVHGREAADEAKDTAAKLFAAAGAGGGAEPVCEITRAAVAEGIPLLDLLVQAGVFASKGEAKRLIQQGGIALAGEKVSDIKRSVGLEDFDEQGELMLKKGKKHYYRLRIS